MDYRKHYDKLIETRRNRVPEMGEYYEKHHIVPTSMGGADVEENKVILTAREHLVTMENSQKQKDVDCVHAHV